MGLNIPNLDDKTFDQLFEEARLLIPQFAPQWTDHNIHDPGITFIELFSWLSEMLMYQLNRVTDINYLKFLKIVGIEPWEQLPSIVDIHFKDVVEEMHINPGEKLITEVGTKKITFETGHDLAYFTVQKYNELLEKYIHVEEIIDPYKRVIDDKVYIELYKIQDVKRKKIGENAFNEIEKHVVENTLLPVELKSVITKYNSKTVDNTQANAEDGVYFNPFGEKASKGSELLLEFNKQLPEQSISLSFYLFENNMPKVGSFDEKSEHIISSVKLLWEYIEYNNSNELVVEPLNVKMDDTAFLTKSGKIILTGPTNSEINEGNGKYTYWIRCRIIKGRYEAPPQINRILLNTISAVQIETVKNEELGESRGIPNQKVILKKKPVIKGSLILQVQGANGQFEQWEEVNNFEESAPDDYHYTFIHESGEVVFGNGLNGRIPIDLRRILAQVYKTTLGAGGNITKGQVFSIDGISGENLIGAGEGRDAESVAHARDRAKKDFRTRYRAINSDDYENLALSTPGIRVARAKALPNYNPDYSNVKVPGTVTVVVVPFMRTDSEIADQPSYIITTYDGNRKTAIVDASFGNMPEKFRYQINTQHDGIAQGGTDSTITLSKTASINNGIYNGLQIELKRGKGVCQYPRTITAYDGKTKIAKVVPKWGVDPDSTHVFGNSVTSDYIPDHTTEYQIVNLQGVSQGVTNREITLDKYASSIDGAYNGLMTEINEKDTPVIGNGFIRTIEKHLNEHRLITTDVHVIDPSYTKISIRCKVFLKRKSSPEDVERRVRNAVVEYLDPLKGGPERKGWPFGRSVYPSEIYQLVDKQEGVNYVTDVSIYATGPFRRINEAIIIPQNGLIYSGSHNIEIE